MCKRVTCAHCECSFFPEEGVSLDDCPKCGRTVEVKPDHIADAIKKVQPGPAPCSGCGCEHDEIHNPTDICATCNGGSRYHMPKPAPAPGATCKESLQVHALPESVESALGVVALSDFPSVESVLRHHISDLTRRLAEADAMISDLRAERDALLKRCKMLEKALQFYADEEHIEWVTKGSPDEDCYEDVDHGKIARKALEVCWG